MVVDMARIPLSMHGGDDIVVDSDGDSSETPQEWITIYGLGATQDLYINMTYPEAARVRDQLDYLLEVWDERH